MTTTFLTVATLNVKQFFRKICISKRKTIIFEKFFTYIYLYNQTTMWSDYICIIFMWSPHKYQKI